MYGKEGQYALPHRHTSRFMARLFILINSVKHGSYVPIRSKIVMVAQTPYVFSRSIKMTESKITRNWEGG
eukprot:2124287-Pleurochrysis_carterae.AAC.1